MSFKLYDVKVSVREAMLGMENTLLTEIENDRLVDRSSCQEDKRRNERQQLTYDDDSCRVPNLFKENRRRRGRRIAVTITDNKQWRIYGAMQ
jgi:hypothetical protein